MTFFQKWLRLSLAIIVSTISTCTGASAQAPGQVARSVSPQPIVKLNVIVVDKSNHVVDDLRQEDFRVLDDGVPQSVSFFSKEEVPASYVLVIDNSASFKSLLRPAVETAKLFINSNKLGDETAVVRFSASDRVEKVQEFTADRAALLKALDQLYIIGGQTAIIDAVYVSAQYVAQRKKSESHNRRALILMTDGEDRASYYKLNKLLDLLHENDAQIFVIGIVEELYKERGLVSKSPREKAVSLLSRLAEETGGLVFFPKNVAELRDAAQEIAQDLRTQYVIGYSPVQDAHSKPYHKVKVTVVDAPGRDKRIAVTRTGYTMVHQ